MINVIIVFIIIFIIIIITSSVLTGGTSDSSILSPTENSLLENPLSFANSRRDSGGALQSPGTPFPASLSTSSS